MTTPNIEELRRAAIEAAQIGMGWVIPTLDPKMVYSVYPLGDDYLIAKFEDTVCAEFCATANPETVISLLDALQSQAERIKELERQVFALTGEVANKADYAASMYRMHEDVNAQLAALQSEDELPGVPGPVAARWPSVPGSHGYAGAGGCAPGSFGEDSEDLYTVTQLQTYARQAQAMVRAKMVPLEKDAARYRWLRDKSEPPHNFYISVPVEFHAEYYKPAEVDAYIDAAMGVTGESK